MQSKVLLAAIILLAVLTPGAQAVNQYPVPSFDAVPAQPKLFEKVRFQSTSVDPDGNVTAWSWDFGDGSVATGESVEHTFFQAGTFRVTLVVTDDQGDQAQVARDYTLASSPLPPWVSWLAPLIAMSILFGIAYVVVAKGQPTTYNRVFFFFYATSATKSLTEASLVLIGNPDLRLHRLLVTSNDLLAYVLVPLFLWFVLVFPRPLFRWLRDERRGAATLLLAVPFIVLEFSGTLDYDSRVRAFDLFASAIAVLALGLLVYHARVTDSDEERRRIRLLSVTFMILVFTTLILTAINVLYKNALGQGNEAYLEQLLVAAAVFGLVITPVLEIIGAAVLMYAILRYQLLGVDRLFIRITRGSLLAIVVPVLFLIIEATIEQIFQDTRTLQGGRYAFIIAALIAAALMIPIQKLITLGINRAFPGWEHTEEDNLAARRLDIFEAQVRYSLVDGKLSEKERILLRNLAKSLGMTGAEIKVVTRRVLDTTPQAIQADALDGLDAPAPEAPTTAPG